MIDRLKVGDLLFIEIDNFLYRRVAAVSRVWPSHVGIVQAVDSGEATIAESAFPRTRLTGLSRFLARSRQRRVCVRRLGDGLTLAQEAALRAAIETRLGAPYHAGFDYAGPKQFCSKFVYDVFREALGVEIGRRQTFADLLAENAEAPTLFWRIWFLGAIPWQRVTITPASQYRDAGLTTVHESAEPAPAAWRQPRSAAAAASTALPDQR